MVYSMAQTDCYTAGAETSIYTDHRNLVFIFDPLKSRPNMPAYLVSKIQSWALILSQFEYVVSHVPGELNYFPDLMTRWGATSKVRRLYVPTPNVESQTFDRSFKLDRVERIHDAINGMHRRVSPASQSKRAAEIARHNKATNVTAINFDAGDFVLIGCPQPQKVNKLTVTWTGPAKGLGFTTPLFRQDPKLGRW